MNLLSRNTVPVLLLLACAFSASAQSAKPGLLTSDEVKKVAPKDYYYRGQSATTQLRNTAGIRVTSDGKMVVAGMVDTSGYSSDIAQKYMGFLITEVKLDVGGSSLAPGQYGFGFTKDGKFVVTDVGANEVCSVSASTDENLKRPVPLKITEDGGAYRLYAGKKWVSLKTE
ncbi:MAG TPA: hypothetical protein VFA89_17355 [Terriglobales bacterium]|nr:hypothetical protein [Terriglobales bacterium]